MEGGRAAFDVVVDDTFPTRASTMRVRQEPLWLPAGFLAVLMTLLMSLSALGGEAPRDSHLKWRSATQTPRAAASPTAARKATAPCIDHNVRRVQYGAELSQPQGKVTVAGIVPTGGFDIAGGVQLAQGGPDFGGNQFADDLEQQLEQPFGAEELPPIDDGDDLPEPENGFPGEGTLPGFGDDDTTQPGYDDLPPTPADPRDRDEQDDDDMTVDEDEDDEPSASQSREDRDREQLRKQRSEAMSNCAEELAELKGDRLTSVDIHIGVAGVEGKDYPFQCSIGGELMAPRCWEQVTYMWKASALCHKPLYFEQVHLERYGHSFGPHLDPIIAGAHFFTRLPALPYCMGIRTPDECVYTLGYYRPGNCAPYMIEPIPFTWRAAAFSAAAWTGGVFLIP